MQGGMPGAERLRDSAPLMDLVAKQQQADKLHAAICATPAVAFEPAGLLAGKKGTAHPAFSAKLSNQEAVEQRVVVDGKLVTSRWGCRVDALIAACCKLAPRFNPGDCTTWYACVVQGARHRV